MEYKERGNKLFKAEKYQKALGEYNTAIKIDPKNATFYTNRAVTFLKLSKYRDAITDCDDAIKIEPNHKTYYIKGKAHKLLNETTEALNSFRTSLELKSSDETIQRLIEIFSGKYCTGLYQGKNFLEEFKTTNPQSENLNFIEEMYSYRNFNVMEQYSISYEPMDKYYTFNRGTQQNILRNQLDPNLRYNFTNNPKKNITITETETIIAIGFVDLSVFLNCKLPETDSTVKFVGYEASLFALIKTKILITMIEKQCCNESIIQVWFSSCWSNRTGKDFVDAINILLEDKNMSEEEKELLVNWKTEKFTIQEAHRLWKENHSPISSRAVGIFNLEKKEDRLQFCHYWATGEVMKDFEIGSTTMFSKYPKNTRNPKNESIYGVLDISQLNLQTKENISLFENISSHLIKSVQTLKNQIKCKKLQLIVNFGFVEINNEDLLKEIKNLNPHRMTWSNVPDYMNGDEFFTILEKCSSSQTTHHVWTMNWQSTEGTSTFDYKEEYIGQRQDDLVESKKFIENQNYLEGTLKKKLHASPISILGYCFSYHLQEEWLKNFFEQNRAEYQGFYSDYNVFAQAPMEIYFTFKLNN
jgi:hypothetical protein